MRINIVPYKPGSKAAKLLAQSLSTLLGYKVWRTSSPKIHRLNLLWGYANEVPNGVKVIQQPAGVRVARSKVQTFAALKAASVPTPEWTTDRAVAQGWVDKGAVVFARTAGGQGGSGITVVETGKVPQKELYTKYIKKLKEFRVHVFNGQAIDIQEKRRKSGVEANNFIRSHDNGWVFCHENIVEPADLKDVAIKAVKACGLFFGAVDVIYNQKQNKCYVLEINSAPGIEGSTVEKYAHAIQNI